MYFITKFKLCEVNKNVGIPCEIIIFYFIIKLKLIEVYKCVYILFFKFVLVNF